MLLNVCLYLFFILYIKLYFNKIYLQGFKPIAHNLIERGAEANLLDANGKSPIFYCENLEDAYELKVIYIFYYYLFNI